LVAVLTVEQCRNGVSHSFSVASFVLQKIRYERLVCCAFGLVTEEMEKASVDLRVCVLTIAFSINGMGSNRNRFLMLVE